MGMKLNLEHRNLPAESGVIAIFMAVIISILLITIFNEKTFH